MASSKNDVYQKSCIFGSNMSAKFLQWRFYSINVYFKIQCAFYPSNFVILDIHTIF